MIEVDDLYVSYGEQEVLKGLSLSVKTGETLVILGRSGVGKSVLLKHIIGIDTPDHGHIKIDGVNICNLHGEAKYQAVLNMGMLFQGAALFDSMNIEDNTGFYLTQHGDLKNQRRYTKREIKQRVDETLEMVDLAGTQKKMPSELSGGMRKRAGLARLIAYRPQYLLYDEPTTGLDPITAMQINELIVETQKKLDATSIVVTHDIVSALFVADRLALHENGKISCIDTPEVFMKMDNPIIEFLRKTISEDPRSLRRKTC